MARLDPYLTFDGNCAEAMRFYSQVFGVELDAMFTFGESPMAEKVPPGSGDRVMHASMTVDGTHLMASDSMPGQAYEGMKGFSLSLNPTTVDEARRLFDALSADGQVTMPLEKTFWAEAFGMLVDRYGTPWMVNVSAPMPS